MTGKYLATLLYYTKKLNEFLRYIDTFGLPSGIEEITPADMREFLAYSMTTEKERWGSDEQLSDIPVSVLSKQAIIEI